MSALDAYKIRQDFAILDQVVNDEPLVYLDNAATTQKPQVVLDTLMAYYHEDNANVHRGVHTLAERATAAYEASREKLRKFINAESTKEVLFTRGTTTGLNWVGRFAEQVLEPGDEVVISIMEHHSNIIPWQEACKKTEAKLVYAYLKDGQLDMEDLANKITEKTKFVSLAQVSNVLGCINPVKEIAKLAHQVGAYMVVDGAQSAPHMAIDVQDLDCDFYAFSAHKMCGPTGVGALYGKKKWLDQLEPIFYGGESNARFDKSCSLTLRETPLKFESGTQPIEGVIGMAAAMDYLDAIGKENIHAHEVELKEYFLKKAEALGNIVVYNENAKSGIVTFNVKDKDQMIFAQDVASYLNTFGIAVRSGQHCAKLLSEVLKTPGTCRASFYLYNTKEEVDQLIDALKNATVENCVSIFF